VFLVGDVSDGSDNDKKMHSLVRLSFRPSNPRNPFQQYISFRLDGIGRKFAMLETLYDFRFQLYILHGCIPDFGLPLETDL
jgi:hypothetical protein